MNRRDFLKMLAVAPAATVSMTLIDKEPAPKVVKEEFVWGTRTVTGNNVSPGKYYYCVWDDHKQRWTPG